MRELHRGRLLQRSEMRTTLHESLSRIQFGESSEQIFYIATCARLAQLDLLITLKNNFDTRSHCAADMCLCRFLLNVRVTSSEF